MSAAKLAARAMKALENNEGDYIGEYAKPMGAFVVRFSGKSLAHVKDPGFVKLTGARK
jgi:hypothetical protein